VADEDDIAELADRGDYAAAARLLAQLPPHEAADEITRLSGPARALTYRFLPKGAAFAAFRSLDAPVQQALVEELRSDEAIALVEHLDPDDRVRLLDEMPALVVKRVLEQLTPAERARTDELIGYPSGTAGRRMSPAVANVHEDATISQAMRRLRSIGPGSETLDVVAVTDDQRMFVGAARLGDLVLADPDGHVADVTDPAWPSLSAYQDEESAARLMQETDLVALPVVDGEGRLVGILTVDDAMEVLEEADTEDFARAGAAQPLRRPYLTATIGSLARSRITWLLLLIVAASLTVQVLGVFEATLEEQVRLALFIPLIIGTGGNAGAQAATTVVRALAVGEVRGSDVPTVIARELATGILLGAMLGVLALGPVSLLFGMDLALVVSGTLLIVCAWASTVGSAMPMLARRVGIDPALVSAPLVTTLVDATGLVAYFLLARAILF
jgi:magnesium transporter